MIQRIIQLKKISLNKRAKRSSLPVKYKIYLKAMIRIPITIPFKAKQ